MGKFGKISTIKREPNSTIQSMDNSLLSKGMSRIPGTMVYKYPYKELDGKYRTGLDPDARYILRLPEEERAIEKERVTKLKKKLEDIFQVDLSPHSSFWNSRLSTGEDDNKHVRPAKLIDGDNYYDYNNPWQELTFAWLRVHPSIAASYEAYQRGEYAADTQFYVVDDEIETSLAYNKKQMINKAILRFEQMTPQKRRKIARQLGLPVTPDTKEDKIYTLIDDVLKQTEFKTGKYRSLSPVKMFLDLTEMSEQLLHVKDLVAQAIDESIYRKKGDHLYEGEHKIAETETDWVNKLILDDNQEDLLSLERKLKSKKLEMV